MRELGVSKGGPGELATAAAVNNYIVRVYTSDIRSAGTDANVFITLYGSKGDSGRVPLEDSATHTNKFERGEMDEFTINCMVLGPLQKIHIGHDNWGLGAGWHLDKVGGSSLTENDNVTSYLYI